MKTFFARAAAGVGTLMLFTLAAFAEPAEEHNFVSEDLTWRTPDPLPPDQIRFEVDLLDTKSIKRTDDTLTFDQLILRPVFNPAPNADKTAAIVFPSEVSCGWRTLHAVRVGKTSGPWFFLPVGDPRNRFIDLACAGAAFDTVGAKSVAEAVAFWQDHFGAKAHGAAITVALHREPAPASIPWVDQAHAFVLLRSSDDTGNMLFIDTASVSHNQATASVVFLIVLGEQAQRARMAPVSIQRAAYDCASDTMTVAATAEWNIFGNLSSHEETARALRHGSESPITAANIHAVCSGNMPTGRVFHSVNEAWDYERSTWPAASQQPN